MKTFICVVLFCVFVCVLGDELNNEEDGFRRLLRRASAEADRPLVREQRRNNDDDEDSFELSHDDVVRKRREEEDQFYHTLLKRAESKRHEKRSFDTDDVDNKDGIDLREDWTGDSKISDADKSELANLFAKLKAGESEVGKLDVTRSTSDDNDDDPTVNTAATDYASWLMKQPKSKISDALTHKADVDHSLTKILYDDERDARSTGHSKKGQRKNVVYPTPANWHGANGPLLNKKSETTQVSNNITNSTANNATINNATDQALNASTESENCTTSSCTCKKTCEPKLVASITPCTCQDLSNTTSANSVGKGLKGQGPKLCTDDSPQCLCTRACYPKATLSLSPCSCEGDKKQATPVATNGVAASTAASNPAQPSEAAAPKANNETSTVNVQSAQAQLCSDLSSECVCKKTCYPNAVARITPCACNTISKSSQSQSQQEQHKPNSESHAQQSQASSSLYPQQPITATNVTQAQPIAAAVTNTTSSQQPVAATNNAPVRDPIAQGWCEQACLPYSVAEGNPCKCSRDAAANGDVKSFPPRAPSLADPNNPEATSAGYNGQMQNSYYYGYGQTAAETATQTANQPQVQQNTAPTNPDTRRLQNESYGSCGRSCSPHRVLSIDPCLCEKSPKAKVPAKKSNATAQRSSRLYLKSPNYQGCFSDLKAPTRDLPKRFTRYDTTPENCVQECKYQNYKFAGVQYGYLCFCGNAFGRYKRLPDNDCNSQCKGDAFRNCGGYYHNSVYSIDGKEYDPTDFDFAKVDEEERRRDTLLTADSSNSAYPSYPGYPGYMPAESPAMENTQQRNTQGANAATHLMKAAQAALFAAQKLLPSVSKKHKVHHGKGKKVKREDDEEDAVIMQEKMSAMASLGAVNDILRKSSFARSKREDSEKEKRSVDEDSDPYDPGDGKELLTAYLSNIDLYKRQTRSVDDDEEDDDGYDKPKFEYRRMTLGETDEGEFVEKYLDAGSEKESNHDELEMRKRSLSDSDLKHSVKRNAKPAAEGSGSELRKRSLPEGSGQGNFHQRKSRSVEGSGQMLKKRSKRSVAEVSGEILTTRHRRSVAEGSGQMLKKRSRRSIAEGSGHMLKRTSRRSIIEGSGQVLKKRRSLNVRIEGSGVEMRKKREMSMKDLPDGAVKMAARSDDIKDVQASLRALELIAKRNDIPKDDGTHFIKKASKDTTEEEEEDENEGESESGSEEDDESANNDESSGDAADATTAEVVDKRSTDESENDEEFTENPKLRSDVDKGVDSLLNLVVELYKQQKTIKTFESSVRSLRNDIIKELSVPNQKKQSASKKVREEIEKRAKERLHVLTSSIENKIRDFGQTHPEALKQADLARTLLPSLPLSDEGYKDATRKISRRAAEFDNIEDAFPEKQNKEIPDILKEHFRRNAEDSVTFDDDDDDSEVRNKRDINGEVKLSRMHRNVQEAEMEYSDDYESLFQ